MACDLVGVTVILFRACPGAEDLRVARGGDRERIRGPIDFFVFGTGGGEQEQEHKTNTNEHEPRDTLRLSC